MKPVRFYESSIVDKDSHLSAHLISVPRSVLPAPVEIGSMEPERVREAEYLMRRLGLHPIIQINPDQISIILTALLSYAPQLSGPIRETSFEAERRHQFAQILENPNALAITAHDREFANYLTGAPLVPVEHSPLEGLSLNDIAKTGGLSVGVYIGVVVAGTSPLLFLTVPAGMIICGAAAGIGMGLFKGLTARIEGLVRSI